MRRHRARFGVKGRGGVLATGVWLRNGLFAGRESLPWPVAGIGYGDASDNFLKRSASHYSR